MAVRVRRVRVEDLDEGTVRYGVLVEADDGRTLVALPAATPEELAARLDECGGPTGLARRDGRPPLDPEGIAPDRAGGTDWVPPED